jgi:dienelactone hydrolase
MSGMRRNRLLVVGLFLAVAFADAECASGPRKVSLAIRGIRQTFYLYDASPGDASKAAVVVISGDGGWHGFITEVAQYLASRGHPVVGVDARDYLTAMSKPRALEPAQVSADFAIMAQFAKEQTGAKSLVLVGWSEGAGLGVLGGLAPDVRGQLRGVVAVGLPELNELAWRWSDSVIYLTKKVPNEPTFDSNDYVGRLAPVPLVMIQSTHDDFVPVVKAREIFAHAQEPKQLVVLDARNHRFEGQRDAFWQALDRTLAWFDTLAAKPSR